MKELEALNKMLGVILAYRTPGMKGKKKAKPHGKVAAKRRQKGVE